MEIYKWAINDKSAKYDKTSNQVLQFDRDWIIFK